MIITLSGTVAHKDAHFAIVEAGGVGYQVHMHPAGLASLKTGAAARLWTHEHVREDARDLFGFPTAAEHRLFERLLAISGVGPKMALNILSLGPVKDIEANIERADVAWLTRVPGIGKKTAQKIVLELKGKLVGAEAGGEGEEVVAALVNLGYARDQAREALAAVPADAPVEDRHKSALRQLAR
jgi:Holliday junction DNA helicase RuvA